MLRIPKVSISHIPPECVEFVSKAEQKRKEARRWGLRIVHCNKLDPKNNRVCGVRAIVSPYGPIEYIDKHLRIRCHDEQPTKQIVLKK